MNRSFSNILPHLVISIATVSLASAAAKPPETVIVTYPAPAGETLSDVYRVQVEGRDIDVYIARVLDPPFAGKQWDYGGPYAFANFDLAGPAEMIVRSSRSLQNAVVRPESAVSKLSHLDEQTLQLRLEGPAKFSLEPDGKKGPLLLFANPLEKDPPAPGTHGVIYFGPGIHKPGRIDVGKDQTLYLAGGAVVKGGVMAAGDNIRIAGRGILDGSDWEWRKGPTPHVISIRGNNIEVEGITIRGASHWTIVPRDSSNVTVRDVKICGSRVQNDDGINPCNSQQVLITDCFIRSDDDCIALKGLDFNAPNSNVEQIRVENTVLWCDRARIFLLGHESRAKFMRQINLRNLDIIHFTMTPFLFEPGEEMRLENVTVENVRIHGEGQREFIRLKPVINQYMRNKVPGHIRDIRFENVAIEGARGDYLVQIEGADAGHMVQRIELKNVTLNGQPLTEDHPSLRLGKHVDNLQTTTKRKMDN